MPVLKYADATDVSICHRRLRDLRSDQGRPDLGQIVRVAREDGVNSLHWMKEGKDGVGKCRRRIDLNTIVK